MTALLDPPETTTGRQGRYSVSVDEYIQFKRHGFLVVRNLVSPEEIGELRRHTDDLMQGRLPEQNRPARPGELPEAGVPILEAPPAHLSPEEKVQYFQRLYMLHRKLELHERYLLHPRVLDVLEVLIGPDILALQSMLFLKPPGKPGQGWHQDSYYIPTHPDTLCGAWIAIDDADELNGAMWMAKDSHAEPVYPPREGYGFGDAIDGITPVTGASDPEDAHNDLSRIADRYDQLLVSASAGDVVFFGGHILHRSKQNYTTDRVRRTFVGHFMNARSFTQWGDDEHNPTGRDSESGMTNGSHLLARGDTHLPFAQTRFGTPCAAQLTAEERRRQSEYAAAIMGDMDSGLMEAMPSDPKIDH